MTINELGRRTAEIFAVLDDLDEDIRKLSERVAAARTDLKQVETEEDAVAFDKKYSDIDAGLKYIEVM
nr:MAG TPA: TolA binding protein [Caudoviricetes sp.]